MSKGKQNFLTIPEEQTFLNTLRATEGDYEAACASVPHIDPAVLPKEAAFKRIGLPIPKAGKKPDADPLA